MMMLFAGQAHALLLGEKARNAPIAGLKSALLRYKLGVKRTNLCGNTRDGIVRFVIISAVGGKLRITVPALTT